MATTFHDDSADDHAAGVTGRTATVSDLNPGDNYSFDLRADRSDGTVSDDVTASANIPAPPAGDSDETLTPPSGISNPQPDSPLLTAYWSGTVDGSQADYDSPDYTEDVGVISDQDNPLHINLGPDDAQECTFGPADPSSDNDIFDLRMDGSSGDTYTVGAYFHTGSAQTIYPPAGEEYSPLSGSVSITMGGTKAPAPDLSLGQPDSAGDPTVDWTLPTGTNAGGISIYRLTNSNGKPSAVLVGFYSGGDTGQATLYGLPLGKSTIFAIDFAGGPGIDVAGFSPYSMDLQVTNTGGAPAAPEEAVAVLTGQSGSSSTVAVHFTNSSGNEANFILQRSIAGGPFADLAELPTDTTSYTDHLSDLGGQDVQYQAAAANAAGQSQPATTQTTGEVILNITDNKLTSVTPFAFAYANEWSIKFPAGYAGTRSGWIVQHVSVTRTSTDAAGNSIAKNQATEDYTEAWPVKNGTVGGLVYFSIKTGSVSTNGSGIGDYISSSDTFKSNAPVEPSTGEIEWKTSAQYYDDLTLPAAFKEIDHGQGWPGILPAAQGAVGVSSKVESTKVTRDYEVEWDAIARPVKAPVVLIDSVKQEEAK
jgi:hypothetical protein